MISLLYCYYVDKLQNPIPVLSTVGAGLVALKMFLTNYEMQGKRDKKKQQLIY